MIKNNKKGQLTIFIIIGIVLLFSAALIIYIRQAVTEYKPPVEIALEIVPTELQPLQTFVTNCIKDVATEAIRKAGLQGGYVDASNIAVNDRDPTSGEGVTLSPGSELKIPYWYYMKSQNTCTSECEFASKQPPLYRTAGSNSVEEQLDKYVEERLSACLLDFAPFKAQGFEIQEGNVDALTAIAKTDVFVQVEYPLTVTTNGRLAKLSKFTAQVPVNLGKFYDLAAELTEKQASTGFLDFLSVNLISSYARRDETRLPPLSDYSFDPGKQKSWLQSEVKKNIEEILTIYTPALQATGTANFQGNLYTGNEPLAKGIYNIFILPLDKTYRVNTEFVYLPSWPTYLDVTPRQGEIIKSESVGGLPQILSFIGFNEYKFAYDLSYPVLITLSDAQELDNEGFVFQFALEANLRSNQPMRSGTTLLRSAAFTTQSLVCKPSNFNSANVTITVTDTITKTAVETALVYFSLGKEACFIGETSAKGVLQSKMPVGIGGLVISKDGYTSKTLPFGTSLGVEQKISVGLDPYREISVSVARVPIVRKSPQLTIGAKQEILTVTPEVTISYQWGPLDSQPGLEPTQFATVSLVRTPENPAQEEYAVTAVFNGSASPTQKVRLVPGKYNIIGTLFDHQRTIVPESKVCYDKEWYQFFIPGEQECTKIDPIPFDIFPKGGVSLASFTIDAASLKNAKELVIYLFSIPDGYSRGADGVTNLLHEDLEQMGKVEQYSKDYFELVKPQFK